MIRIERPEYRRRCNCCFRQEGAKEIHFIDNMGNGTIVCLCAGCQKELAGELKRHYEPSAVQREKDGD